MTAYECDNCDWFDRDEICDECRERNSLHRHTVMDDEEDTLIFNRISICEEEE